MLPPDLQWIPVESSSNVKEYAYKPETQTLYVHFLPKRAGEAGSLYAYHLIEQDTFDALEAAESKGKYLYAHIKKPWIPYEKIALPR